MNEIDDKSSPDLEIKFSKKNTTPIIQNKMNKEFYTRIKKFLLLIKYQKQISLKLLE